MKKSILRIPLVLLALLALTACKKDYTCTCNFSYLVDGQTVNETGTHISDFSSKSQAKEFCADWEETYINTGASSADCVSSAN